MRFPAGTAISKARQGSAASRAGQTTSLRDPVEKGTKSSMNVTILGTRIYDRQFLYEAGFMDRYFERY